MADYADDNNELLSCGEIDDLCHPHMFHLLISGWSDENKDCSSLITDINEIFGEPSNKSVGLFRFLDISLDTLINQAKLTNSDAVNLENVLKACLKHIHNYINIALAYKEERNGEIRCDYQTRVTGNNLKHQIDCLKELILVLQQRKNAVSCVPYSEIIGSFLYPGIELVSGKSIDGEVLDYLSEEIQKSNLFFDLPYSVLSNTFHLYHHPKNSFPLPVLLKSSQDMEKAEYWKGIDWKDDYQDYLNDFRKYKKYIVLGYYTRDNEDGCEGPHIVLCPENIEDAASDSNLKDKKELLYLIVLIHELAHAMMDKNNVTLNTLFSNAMEESLANMIALQWFDVFDEQNKDNVKDFINDNQPKIYKFGINQFEATVDWRRWRDCNKNMRDKLEYWFNKCFEGGEIRNIESSAVKTEYDNVFL